MGWSNRHAEAIVISYSYIAVARVECTHTWIQIQKIEDIEMLHIIHRTM